MDFWNVYEARRTVSAFGTKQFLLNTGERYNTSIAGIKDRSVELAINDASYYKYMSGRRYVTVSNITFDLLASFYDTNSRSAFMMRLTSPFRPVELSRAAGVIRKMRNPNIEVRFIGLQNNDSFLLHSIIDMKKISDGNLVEADLFGDQVRHVAIDLYTGKPYHLLLENRIYRPGELNSSTGIGDFQKDRSELHFV
jgi:hypothetical protein